MSPIGSQKRILGLVAENENRVLEFASQSLGHSFAETGYEYQPIDLVKPAGGQELADALKSGAVAFAFGMAGVGSQLTTADGKNLWAASRTPFVGFWNDHPAYNYRQHSVVSPYIINAYHVRDHYDIARKYWPDANAKILLPTFSVLVRPDARHVPWNERKRIFLFVKRGHSPVQIRNSWKDFPKKLQDVLEALTEQALCDRNIDLIAGAELLFVKAGHPPNDINMLMGVVAEVDGYIRAWRSDRLARALLLHPAHIVGSGWEYLHNEPRKAEFLPSVHAYSFVKECLQYRLIANSSPLWRDGIHERIGHGIAAGNVVLTDRTVKGDYVFRDLSNYVGFEWNDDLKDVLEIAWHKSQNNEDYFVAAETRIHQHMMNIQKDFVRPVEEAVRIVREKAG